MGGLEILFWSIPILFALALLFAILLWCRTWRREEGAEMDRRIRLLTTQVTKLSELVERLEKAQAASRAAESRLSEQFSALSSDVTRLLSARPAPASHPGDESPSYPSPIPNPQSPSSDRYERMRELLSSGVEPVEVARQLDVSLGDVQVIQRLMNLQPKRS